MLDVGTRTYVHGRQNRNKVIRASPSRKALIDASALGFPQPSFGAAACSCERAALRPRDAAMAREGGGTLTGSDGEGESFRAPSGPTARADPRAPD